MAKLLQNILTKKKPCIRWMLAGMILHKITMLTMLLLKLPSSMHGARVVKAATEHINRTGYQPGHIQWGSCHSCNQILYSKIIQAAVLY